MKSKVLTLLISILIGFNSIAQTPKELVDRGDNYYFAGNYTEAIKWYRQAANKGDSNAQLNLGICYYYGNGVARDFAEAVKWYRKAAEQENGDAQLALGKCYQKGKGVNQSDSEAEMWFQKAAENGCYDFFDLPIIEEIDSSED